MRTVAQSQSARLFGPSSQQICIEVVQLGVEDKVARAFEMTISILYISYLIYSNYA